MLGWMKQSIAYLNVKQKIDNHWKDGRQGTGYQRFALLPIGIRKLFKFDIILLRMRPGIEVPLHFDKVPVQHQAFGLVIHKRLNILLRKPKIGGEFFVRLNVNANIDGAEPEWEIYYPKKRVVLFTPSRTEHGVTMVEEGTRYVLSFGWLSR